MIPDLLHLPAYDTAETAPDRPVFAVPEATISYAELVDRASRLARVLVEHNIGRGDRIGVYFQKSIESAIAIYGVMQAGAVYVPLDPAAPPDRTRSVLEQCEARALVTHDAQTANLEKLLPLNVNVIIGTSFPGEIGVDTVAWSDVLVAEQAPATAAGAADTDLGYIIFTSGSTGAPKGIMHTHRSGLSYSRMAGQLYDVGPEDRLTSLSPLHFDMSTFDYLCGPQHGAMTMIVPDPYMKLPASMSELVQDEALTIWYSVPFALTQLLLYGAMDDHDLTSLRLILFGGEPFAPKHLAALTERLPRARFSNVYGPAEVNQCTYYHLPSTWRETDGQPPIGVPCANAEVRVVDEDLEVVAPGVTGEMIVQSPSVMRGYWGRANLNDRTLLRRSGLDGVEEIWLRTGDLAQWEANGLLSFHGRVDRQVKVRGYRVELDEIEDVLASHEAVEEAAAFPVHASDTMTLIHAAVTVHQGTALTSEVLQRYAAERLPGYAIPSIVAVVSSFPRTSSGKIDWKSLGSAASENLRTEGQTHATGNQ